MTRFRLRVQCRGQLDRLSEAEVLAESGMRRSVPTDRIVVLRCVSCGMTLHTSVPLGLVEPVNEDPALQAWEALGGTLCERSGG